MRVHELAKKLKIQNKELLSVLKKGKFAVTSHMSALTAEAVDYAQKALKVSNAPKKASPEKTTEQQKRKDGMQKESIKKPAARRQSSKKNNRPQTRRTFTPVVEKQAESNSVSEIIVVPMTVLQLAEKIEKPVNDLILTLLQSGVVATINHQLPVEVIEKIARHFNITPIRKKQEIASTQQKSVVATGSGKLSSRLPVIVVLGHVDHGKTTLLDYIRKTRVVAKEKGGITQHLGAYEANTEYGNLVFLDTPGHAAFPKMRQRGIRVADLAILVVAADDGIMPQTIEAIKYIKEMNVPVVVALNKMDKADKIKVEQIKRQLAEHDLLVEDWGGSVVCVPVSALKGDGVNKLLEMVALQAEMLELRAALNDKARGYILESKLEKGRGPVATVICQYGTLKVGDYFIVGDTYGRISSMQNSYGKNVVEVGPSIPVQVAGFNELPNVGDLFSVEAKDDIRAIRSVQRSAAMPSALQGVQDGAINLIIKADANSSKEALTDSIAQLSKSIKAPFYFVFAGVGNISESDVELAYNTGSRIVGLHVKIDAKTKALAQKRNVTIELYGIIYKLLEALESQFNATKKIETERVKVGEATVLKVFDIKGVGVIAGSMVNDGRLTKGSHMVAFRGKEKIGEGKITSLQRDRKTVKEVHNGFECGFVMDGFKDWQEGDRAECYIEVPKKK